MIRTIFILFLFLFAGCLSGELHAQMFRGGMQAGLTASEVSGDDAGGPEKLGWFASVFTNMDVRPHTRLQLELMYIQKGSRVFRDPWADEPGNQNGDGTLFHYGTKEDDPIEPGPDGYRDYKFYLHYVEIPLMVQFDFSPVTRLPYVELMSGEIGLSVSTVVGHYEESLGKDVTDDMAERRPFTFAELNILAGLRFPITDGLSFQARYSQGVTPVRTRYAKDEIACTNSLECYRKRHQFNSVWSFGLTYTFLTRF